MRIHNVTPVALAYDKAGRQVQPFSAVTTKMNPVVRGLLDAGKVITVHEPTDAVPSESRPAGHKVTQERDQ